MSKQGQRAEDSSKGSTSEKATGPSRAQKEEQKQNRSAQSNENKGTTAGSNESQAGKERNKSAAENERGKRSYTAQERERTGRKNAAEPNRGSSTAAEQQNRTGGGNRNAERGRTSTEGTAAEQQNRTGGGNRNAERGRTSTEGLQGNASGMNVRLSEQQRNEIRTTVINGRNAPRVSHVDFDVTVGTVIPRGRIHVVPVPETLVRIEPQWRGFLYFIYEDEVVIVSPNDMKIVAVVPA